MILERLSERFRLGVVSNFYGTSRRLRRNGARSAPRRHHGLGHGGLWKPDPRIFQAALSAFKSGRRRALHRRLDAPRHGRGAEPRHAARWVKPGGGKAAARRRRHRSLAALAGAVVTAPVGGGDRRGRGLAAEGARRAEAAREGRGRPLIEHVLGNFEAAGIASAAVIFNEAEKDCEAFVRERFGTLVSKIVVKTTRSSLESFREILDAAPPGRLLVSTVDAFCPRTEFVRFVRRAEALSSHSTVLAVTGYVHDEKPLWVTTTRKGRVTVVGGASGDAVTAGIYVFPEKVRQIGIPSSLGRLRDFLAWLAKSGEPIEAVDIPKVVDVDRAEDVAAAEERPKSSPRSRRDRGGVRGEAWRPVLGHLPRGRALAGPGDRRRRDPARRRARARGARPLRGAQVARRASGDGRLRGRAPGLFVMCERIPIVERLAAWERRGARIVNRPAGIRNTDRERTIALFEKHGVAHPKSVLVATASGRAAFPGPLLDQARRRARDRRPATCPSQQRRGGPRREPRALCRARHREGRRAGARARRPDQVLRRRRRERRRGPRRPGSSGSTTGTSSRTTPSTPTRWPPRRPGRPRRSGSRCTAATRSSRRPARSR